MLNFWERKGVSEMNWIKKPWRDARGQTQAKRLYDRLQKFCSTDTPEQYREQGEQWGEGQFEITINRDEVYRGKIKQLSCLQEPVGSTLEGLPITLELFWLAKKKMGKKFLGGDRFEPTWEWKSLPATSFPFTIRKFRQNITHTEKDVLFPKRLFFVTSRGEEGYFTQRNDPENLRLENNALVDPLQH